MSARILVGDCRTMLATLDAGSVQTCVTSPPYFGLRDYGVDGQIGLEPTPDAYVAELVAVFRDVRRVLKDDGTLWLNLGDSYAGSGKGGNPGHSPHIKQETNAGSLSVRGVTRTDPNAKPKDLLGIPWRVAFALQADGWYLRSDIIWHKPNPMPESVTDRPTKAHEYVFLLSKSERYCYDAGAIAELATGRDPGNVTPNKHAGEAFSDTHANLSLIGPRETRNARTVWTIATQPYSGAHFATMPPALAERCVKAGSARGDTVLDPFAGAGTTGLVADRLGRDFLGVELNPAYAELARTRILSDAPLFSEVA